MGLADLFGPQFAGMVAPNRGVLGQIGAGLASGQNFSAGLANAAQNMPLGRQQDDAYAAGLKADAERADQLNQSIKFMQDRGYNDLAQAAKAGQLGPAWNEAMRRSAPQGPGEAFTLGAGDTRYGADGSVIAQGGPDNKAAFSNESDLYKQYASADPVKTYQAVRGSYERVRSAAEMGNSNADGSGAADISLVFAYMKMLDPTSVVREGEVATANSAGGVPASVLNMYNNLVKGDKLTPQVRGQFVQSADAIYKDTENNLRDANGQFTTRAQGWGVDPNNFIQQPEQYPAFAPPAAAQGDVRTTPSGATWSR